MDYKSFTLENFKGVRKITLDLDNPQNINIYTLVGLNESGKTTILEAINYFQNDELDENTLIPKSKRANFNENITIQATLQLDKDDEEKIKRFLKGKNFILAEPIETITVTRELTFLKSTFTKKRSVWGINLIGLPSKSRARKNKNLIDFNKTLWEEALAFVEEFLFPKIVYYENFLFDFPDTIYLEPSEGEGREQGFYRNVIQDVLNSLKESLTISEHLVERKRTGTPNDQENIEKVLNSMSGVITKKVFDTWKKVSGIKNVSKISVTLGNDVKVEKDSNRLYIEIRIKEGTDSYFIRERSLGFRWFFSFLLFAQFRKERATEAKNTLFLLDEPASNLHQTGQQELLNSIEKLTEGSTVIYSTHSHHLINPKWLSGAFIVKNKGLNPDKKSYEDDFNAVKTDIVVEKYFKFVAHYPNEESHYKPILDVIDYKPSKLENIPDIVITEGKFDFYILSYIQDFVLKKGKKIHFYPGAGKDKHYHIISLYLSWGRSFVVLLDSDDGGEKTKKRYLDEFGKTVENRIITFSDISQRLQGYETEDLFNNNEKIDITKQVFPEITSYNKSTFNTAIQHLYINKLKVKLTKITKENFRKIFNFLLKKI